MKKLILFFAAILFAASVSAERGSMVVSGGADFHSQNEANQSPSSDSFGIFSNFQYFLTDRFSLGVSADFHTHKWGDIDRRNTVGVGLFGRYYLLKTDRFGVFGQAGSHVRFANEAAGDWTGLSFTVSSGVQYFINSRWSVESRFGVLSFSSQFADGMDTRNSFNASVTSGLSLSVNFHF